MLNYEEKRQARIERMRELAEKNKEKSKAMFETADKMQSVIPFGQPILVGHHSEKRDRNYRNKIWNKMKAASELDDKAHYYEEKARIAENNNAISSDDPDAPDKLQTKIDNLEKQQETMREFNKALRKNDIARMLELGFTEEQINKLKTPDCLGRVGFPNYALTNNSANIRRLKQRLESIKQRSTAQSKEVIIGEVRFFDNVEDNRLQIFFPCKPEYEMISLLKHSGFRWSPFNKCWQAFRSNHATYRAQEIIQTLKAKGENKNEPARVDL